MKQKGIVASFLVLFITTIHLFSCSLETNQSIMDISNDTSSLDIFSQDQGGNTDSAFDAINQDQGDEPESDIYSVVDGGNEVLEDASVDSDTELSEDGSVDTGADVLEDVSGNDVGVDAGNDAGTKRPVYVGLFIHLEGWPETEEAQREYYKKIREYEALFSSHGAKLTFESKELAQNIIKYGDNVLAEMEKKGHTIGSHADIGTELYFTKDSFISSLITKKKDLERIGTHPRHVSGVCSWLDWSNFVGEAGFLFVTSTVQYCLKSLPPQNQPEMVKNCLEPAECHAPYPLELKDRIHPWRMSSNDWTKSDPQGKVVNIPSASLLPCLYESVVNPNNINCTFDDDDIQQFFNELDEVINLADDSQITVYMPGWSFGTPLDMTMLEKWLTQMDTYVASGRVAWKTAGEIYDEFVKWEKNGGISIGPGDGRPDGELDNASKINFILENHAGEGEDVNDCMMDGNTTLTTAKYIICRDGLKDINKALTDGTLKTPNGKSVNLTTVIELHPRFLDLLASDEESGKGSFSFADDILTSGHQLGVHNHYECHTGADGGSKCYNAVNNWGVAFLSAGEKKEPGFPLWYVRITTYDYLFDTLHNTLLSKIVFDPISIWGTDYLIKTVPDVVVGTMVDAGYTTMTSHGMFTSSYDKTKNPECYAAEMNYGLNSALIHKLVVTNSENKSIIYYDNRPATFGETTFNNKDLTTAFESALKCMMEEKSPDDPYVFVVATHLHNIIANPSTKYKWKGIEDIQNTITILENFAGKYSKKIEYTTFNSLK